MMLLPAATLQKELVYMHNAIDDEILRLFRLLTTEQKKEVIAALSAPSAEREEKLSDLVSNSLHTR